MIQMEAMHTSAKCTYFTSTDLVKWWKIIQGA